MLFSTYYVYMWFTTFTYSLLHLYDQKTNRKDVIDMFSVLNSCKTSKNIYMDIYFSQRQNI